MSAGINYGSTDLKNESQVGPGDKIQNTNVARKTDDLRLFF